MKVVRCNDRGVRIRLSVLALLSTGSLVACGGSTVSPLQTSPIPSSVGFPLSVAINVPPPVPIAAIKVTIDALDDPAPQLSANGPCSNSGCTLPVQASLGYDNIDIVLSDALSHTVYEGAFKLRSEQVGSKAVEVAFGGDPASVGLSVEPADLDVGTAATATLSIVAKDAQGRRILGSIPFSTPVQVAATDAAAVTGLSATQFTNPAQTIAVKYNGGAGPMVTFSPSGTNVRSAQLGLVAPSGLTDFDEATSDERRASVEELEGVPRAALDPRPLTRVPLATAASVDLSPNFPPIGDQGKQKSCTAWSSTYGIRSYMQQVATTWGLTGSGTFGINPDHVFSPAFLWTSLNRGRNEGVKGIRAAAFLKTKGAVPWTEMPWIESVYSPPPNAGQLADGQKYRIGSYSYIDMNSSAMATVKQYLSNGYPVFWAVQIDSNFKALEKIHGPEAVWSSQGSGPEQHAMTLVGYDDARGVFKIRNSWGTKFGDNGYAYVTYDWWSHIPGTEMYVFSP